LTSGYDTGLCRLVALFDQFKLNSTSPTGLSQQRSLSCREALTWISLANATLAHSRLRARQFYELHKVVKNLDRLAIRFVVS
jgi:hypothetical protein